MIGFGAKKCSNEIIPGAFSFMFSYMIRDALVLQTVRGKKYMPCSCVCVCVCVCVLQKLIDKLLLEIEA
jgi:hypothetical protein